MEISKQYIVQCIILASNNLRLTPEKIEIVALLRECISGSQDLGEDIKKLKKITETAKLAIRMSEILDYLLRSKLDFVRFTEKFKEHAQSLIKEINFLLENTTPSIFKGKLEILKNLEVPPSIPLVKIENSIVEADFPQRKSIFEITEISETDRIKENIIFDNDKDDDSIFFQNFEETIMRPIKQLEQLLKSLPNGDVSYEEINKLAEIMKNNSDISEKFGTEIITNMHMIFAKALILIRNKELMPGKEIVEALRSCLIVIVALVRNKEVDIAIYLNRAEEFGKRIQTMKIKEF